MATLTALVTEVRDELQEPTAGLWSDAEIKRWLNDANHDLTRAAQIEAAPSTITTVSGTESYALPATFGYMRRCELDTDGSGDYRSLVPSTIDARTTDTGEPVEYVVYNDRLYLFPIPDAAYTVKIWYHQTQADLGDSDSPVIPAEFDRLLVLFACAMAKRKVDDPAYTTYAQDYQAGRADMIHKLSQQGQQERYQVIRDDWEAFTADDDWDRG